MLQWMALRYLHYFVFSSFHIVEFAPGSWALPEFIFRTTLPIWSKRFITYPYALRVELVFRTFPTLVDAQNIPSLQYLTNSGRPESFLLVSLSMHAKIPSWRCPRTVVCRPFVSNPIQISFYVVVIVSSPCTLTALLQDQRSRHTSLKVMVSQRIFEHYLFSVYWLIVIVT